MIHLDHPIDANDIFIGLCTHLNEALQYWIEDLPESFMHRLEEIWRIEQRHIVFFSKDDSGDFVCIIEVDNNLVVAKTTPSSHIDQEGWYQVRYKNFVHGFHRVNVVQPIIIGEDLGTELEGSFVNALRVVLQMIDIKNNKFNPIMRKSTRIHIHQRAQDLTVRLVANPDNRNLVWVEGDQVQNFSPKHYQHVPDWAKYDRFRPTERIAGLRLDRE